MSIVYLLHFNEPYKRAKHYIGFTENLDERLAHHRKGTGARLMQVLKENNIGFECVRTWENADRNFERSLKNKKNALSLCPKCKDEHAEKVNKQKREKRKINNENKRRIGTSKTNDSCVKRGTGNDDEIPF